MIYCPEQLVVGPVICALGKLLTLMVTEAVLVQLYVFEAVTVYVVDVVGETLIVGPVAPLLHVYETPPLAVSVVFPPKHIVVLPLMVMLGVGLTFTVTFLG